MLLRGNLRDLANGGFNYGNDGRGDGLGHYGHGYGDGDGFGYYGYGFGGYGNVNIENHGDAEYVAKG
tara:strand:+ start:166 stop:366 length:201 start_codon:yes stop_codon:yes gene_type:complete